jgi:hypothetical protein
MMGLLGQQGLSCHGMSGGLGTGLGRLLVGTPTGKNRLSGLRCAGIVQSVCHGLPWRDAVETRLFAALHALKS